MIWKIDYKALFKGNCFNKLIVIRIVWDSKLVLYGWEFMGSFVDSKILIFVGKYIRIYLICYFLKYEIGSIYFIIWI